MERYPSAMISRLTYLPHCGSTGAVLMSERTRGPWVSISFISFCLYATTCSTGVIPPLMPRGGNYLIKNQFPQTIKTTAARLRLIVGKRKSHFCPMIMISPARDCSVAAVLGEISVYRTELQRTDVSSNINFEWSTAPPLTHSALY